MYIRHIISRRIYGELEYNSHSRHRVGRNRAFGRNSKEGNCSQNARDTIAEKDRRSQRDGGNWEEKRRKRGQNRKEFPASAKASLPRTPT